MRDADFRTAYDALLEEMPDPPSFEQLRTQTLQPRRREVPGWRVAVLAAVAVLLGFGGLALLAGGDPDTGNSIEGVEGALAEAVADVGGLCNESSTTADFDGDGLDDAVAVGFTGCGTQADPSDPTMVVAWASGSTYSWALDECGVVQPDGSTRSTGICDVFAAPDLNADGGSELAVKVQQAAGSTALLQFYALTPDEPSQSPIQLAPAGPAVVLMYGSSPTNESNIRCTTNSQGQPVFLVTVAEFQNQQWSVFEGTWYYDGRLIDFRSQRTYSVSKDAPDVSELITDATFCGATVAGGQRHAELRDHGMSLTYPVEWHLADVSLTPNLASPTEVFSLGSFPLEPGGPNCAQIPSQALHDMTATDVFVTVQERGSDLDTSGFDPRPDEFGPTPGSADNVFNDCLDPDELADIDAIHWLWFTDQDRYFHVLAAIGASASPEDTAAVWSVLDQMDIQPGS